LTAGHLGTLTIVGRKHCRSTPRRSARSAVKGDPLNTVQTNDEIGTILVTGSRNMITVSRRCHVGGRERRRQHDSPPTEAVRPGMSRTTVSANTIGGQP